MAQGFALACVVALVLVGIVEPDAVIRCDDTSWWCQYLGICWCGPVWP